MALIQEETSWHAVMVAAYRKWRTTELQHNITTARGSLGCKAMPRASKVVVSTHTKSRQQSKAS